MDLVSQKNYNSKIKGPWSQITMTNKIMKKFEILWELSKYYTDTQSNQIVLEKQHKQTSLMQGCYKPFW